MASRRLTAIAATISIGLASTTSSPAFPAQNADSIRVEQGALLYDDLSTDRLRFKVKIRVAIPWSNLTLSTMRFESLTANGFPLVVEPYEGRIDLEQNEMVELPEPLLVSIYFREISSLDPLRELLSQKSTTIRGSAHLTLRTRGALKIVTLGRKLRRSLELEQEVKMDLLEHPLARLLANQMLRELADPNSLLGTEWLEQQLQLQSLVRRGADLEPALVAVTSRFSLAQGTDRQELTGGGMGFFVDRRRVVTTKQAVQPWKFDPEIAYSQQQGFHLDPEGYEVVVAAGSAPELSLRREELELTKDPPDDLREETYAQQNSEVFVQTHRIDSPQALTLLRVSREQQRPDETPRALQLEPAPEKGRLLVGLTYYQTVNGDRLLRTGWALATARGNLLRLDRSFPEEATGAPVFDDKGRVRAIFVGKDICLPIQLFKNLGIDID